jgi:hypothetical protein
MLMGRVEAGEAAISPKFLITRMFLSYQDPRKILIISKVILTVAQNFCPCPD